MQSSLCKLPQEGADEGVDFLSRLGVLGVDASY